LSKTTLVKHRGINMNPNEAVEEKNWNIVREFTENIRKNSKSIINRKIIQSR
jgi:hypothetical protein